MSKRNSDNLRVQNYLRGVNRCARVVHAYIFCGDPSASAELAEGFAKDLLCREPVNGAACGRCLSCRKFDHGNQEDLIRVTKSGVHLLTKDMEELQEKLRFKSFGDRRVVLIEEADSMQAAAQNKLLKTLEEPPEGTILLLTARMASAMLPTVMSRCAQIAVASEEAPVSREAAEAAERFALLYGRGTPFYKMKEIITPLISSDSPRELATEFLDRLEEIFENSLYAAAGAAPENDAELSARIADNMGPDALKAALNAVSDARKAILQNSGTAYVLKTLCLDI